LDGNEAYNSYEKVEGEAQAVLEYRQDGGSSGTRSRSGSRSRRRLRNRHSFTQGQQPDSTKGSAGVPAQELGRALFGMCPTGRENELTLRLMADCTTVTRDWRALLSPSEQYGSNQDFEPLNLDTDTGKRSWANKSVAASVCSVDSEWAVIKQNC
jgi:hypothetical protein